MKKILFYLLIISCLGIGTSLLLLLLEIITYILAIQLVICSLFGCSVFFSLYILKRENTAYFAIHCCLGILFFLLFIWGIYTPKILTFVWTYLLSGISFLVISALYCSVKKSNKVLSFLSLLCLITAALFVCTALIFQVHEPLYYKIVLLILFVSSGFVLLSTLFTPTSKDSK